MQVPSIPKNVDLVGRRFFGEYTITKMLGEGGMGAVYLARQNAIDQMVALKVLHARAAESNEIIQRFHREAKVISMLSHPNIVRVFIFGRTDDGLLYLVMEHVDGRELRDDINRHGTLDELQAIKIIKQMCSALAEAHDLGIIHRDLKPDNVLLTDFRGDENFVKILDFGIAKLNEPEGQTQQKLTQAGIVYGTPEYLSPEQAQALDLDHRTDIYSLGCMLYELICGRVPFAAESPVQLLTKHVFEDPPPPSKVAPRPVAPTMERIILKALDKKPEGRFESALAMFDALTIREQEIVRERRLDARATYFPGSELTNIRAAVDAQPRPAGAGPAAPASNPTLQMEPPHHPQPAPGLASSGQFPQSVSANLAPQAPSPPQRAPDSSSRKIIIAAIIALLFVLLALVGFIAFQLFRSGTA